MKKRLIAIHLPQFHPFKENDEWWGKGFTEWTNVAKAKPRFKWQYQPHIPADLGFYDLRLEESRIAQAELAKEYGIYGFCYYHYWFNGKQLMERPIKEILSSGKPDFPFMLCWANENWSRNWNGGFSNVLIEQIYSLDDDRMHMEYLCKEVFCDKRYIRINNKPFFVIYKPDQFPDMKKTIEIWREVALKYGMELYLAFMERDYKLSPLFFTYGFDAAIDFQPRNRGSFGESSKKDSLLYKVYSRLLNSYYRICGPYNEITDYKKYIEYRLSLNTPSYKLYPAVTPNFDNLPRRENLGIAAFKGSTPQLYGEWLKGTMSKFTPFSKEENYVFINAWNEWAEGNHLEPDLRWGRQYLEATLDALKEIGD
jgi:lipopolysaccharide biosynthesis protein